MADIALNLLFPITGPKFLDLVINRPQNFQIFFKWLRGFSSEKILYKVRILILVIILNYLNKFNG